MASTTSSSAGSTGQNNIGPIVGGVIGTVVVCALIVFAAIFVLRKHRRHLRKHWHEQHTSDHYRYTPPHSFGADGTRKPDERQSTIPVTILLSELGDVNHEKPAEIELDGENEREKRP
ncbi:hypothetical protein BC938DRAFT_484210 [Jimgerdemannia flammicorona]|uniref:Uncharacterized protein n=1 Tax=Jimgerdemannia flammicorona TaxID=994334 RepID=A0A433QVH3_9FUNG|nr:hypothetical protein BC938DRAFT_484210 [Jimgerdemannia flammicorona]